MGFPKRKMREKWLSCEENHLFLPIFDCIVILYNCTTQKRNPMRITIDTSVIIAVLLNEPERDRVIHLTTDAEVIVPASLHWEIGNAFSAMFKRKRITLKEAQQAINRYAKMVLQTVDIRLADAIKIANKYDIYAYDAYFIVCAGAQRTPLLTLDNKLSETARKNRIQILEI